jgi:hypothetical protein
MIKKELCLQHAELWISMLFKGQKMLVDTNLKQPGEIIPCNFFKKGDSIQCQKVAAVRVLIFNQNENPGT